MKKWSFWIGIVLAGISTVILLISIWPVSAQIYQIELSNPESITGSLVLSQLEYLHQGDKAKISLEVKINPAQGLPSSLVLISKFEARGLDVIPKGEGKVIVDPTKSMKLNWLVTPFNVGSFDGTLWLFFENNTGEKELLLARPIEITAKSFLGFSYRVVRTIATIGLVVSVGLILIGKRRKQKALFS